MSAEAWEALRALFRRWTGMVLPDTIRGAAVELLHRKAAEASRDPLAYLRALDADHAARQPLLDQLGLGTTWFMRDETGLRALTSTLARRAQPGQTVTVWSVGCSSGEEAYSLAMTLAEAGVDARVLGTDLNRLALRRAADGRYAERSLRRVPEPWRARFFDAVEPGVVRVKDELRARVSFMLHNALTSDGPPGGWSRLDAVVCRNVLLYFERDQALSIIERLARSCRPGGYLLLGAIERPLFWMSKLATREQVVEFVQLSMEQPTSRITQRSLVAAKRSQRRSSPSVESAWLSIAAPAPRPGPVAGSSGPPPELARLLDRAAISLEQGRLANALVLVDAAIACSPVWAPAHLARGLVLKHAGRAQEAIEALRASRFLDGHAWLAPYQLALCLDSLGEYDDAIEAYRHALGVLEGAGKSGLHRPSAEIESLAKTAAEVCRGRIGAPAP